MHDACLDGNVGERDVDRIGKALQAIHDSDHDGFDPAIAQIIHHRELEFGPFIIGDPQVLNLAFAFRGDAQGHANGLAFNLTAFRIADFDPDRIEKK